MRSPILSPRALGVGIILALLVLSSAGCNALSSSTTTPALAPAPPVALSIPDIVLYYPFDGDVTDMSGHHNNGQVNGAVLTSDRFGAPNHAYYFDGVDDSIAFDASTMPVGASPRTISAWIKADGFPPAPENLKALGSRATVIGWGKDDALQLSEMQIVDRRLTYHDYNLDRMSTGVVELGQWYHLVIVYTEQHVTLYVNGAKEEFDSGPLNTMRGRGRIGAFCDPTVKSDLFPDGYDLSYFHGVIDEIAVYGRALTDEQVMSLYHEGGWQVPIPTSVSATLATVPPPPAPTPTTGGRNIVVTSAEDSGPGTLRQALQDAQTGDIITFDPAVFPPDRPTTIFLQGEGISIALPELTQGHLTVDASDAGVILDGSKTRGDWVNCLGIRSDGNVIRGLQIVSFPGSGIAIMDGANNIIGGDRTIGAGPVGQGNLSSSNRTGIDLQGDGTSYNTILGNLVGTDAEGSSPRGNEGTGIYVARGASHNTIGPGNIVAYNSDGVQVSSSNSVANTITQNSIHNNGNGEIGISLSAEGNANSSPPSIVGYDIPLGTVTVLSCPHCTVEIFSDEGGQGRTYEGRGKADAAGSFTLDKNAPFAGPHLTATTTDLEGNTSGFSLATSGVRESAADALRSIILQDGNNNATTELVARQSGMLDDSRIGTMAGSLWQPEPEVFPGGIIEARHILEMGFKRFRFTINCLDISRVDWSKPELSIDPSHDEFITSLASNGVKMTYVLSFWDTAYKAQGGQTPVQRFKTEEDVRHYLDYVRFIVHHFRDRIEYYEIWNEPNLAQPGQWMQVEDYIDLVKQAVPVIRQEYPEAKIVVGGTTSLIDTHSQAYLFSILQSDIMPLVDVISWHPMYGSSPEYDEHRQYYYDYPSLVQRMEDEASAHGFRGEYEADEIHWPTPAQPEPGWPTYSNIQSIKYLTRSILIHRGMDVTVTQLLLVGSSQLRRANAYLSTIMAGAEPTTLPVKIQSEAIHKTSYGFSLPSGDMLVALWDDAVAVDYDPGTPSTIIVPGHAGWRATAVDVLNGFEQTLISSDEGGDLVIRDFLLKDYPIVIRLSE